MQFIEVSGAGLRRQAPHILVVDDERAIVDLLCMMLEEEGFRVTGVTTGHGAAEVIRNRPPDLMLTDVMMPGTTGFDLAELAADVQPEIRVVLMSAAVDSSAVRKFPFIPKPFDLGSVIDIIEAELRAS
jgi:DNA-binding NtrC family response regulator